MYKNHLRYLILAAILLSKTASAAFPDDFSNVTWIDPNISSWNQNSNLTVSISGDAFFATHSKQASWPIGPKANLACTNCNANLWAFIKHNGTWYACTWEYLRANTPRKEVSAFEGKHLKRPPFFGSGLATWRPTVGHVYGFMVSGFARFNLNDVNIQARSNVFLYRWGVGPTDNIIYDDTPALPPPTPNPDPVIEFHTFTGTASGTIRVVGPELGDQTIPFTEAISFVVGDDRSLSFTVDGQSFSTDVKQDGSFSGSLSVDIIDGLCNVTINVAGVVNSKNASGTVSGVDTCSGNNLTLNSTFTASSPTAPNYVDTRNPPNIGPVISILLDD